MISKSAATQFSVMIIESTGITESIGIITESTRTVRAYVTKHQLGKRFSVTITESTGIVRTDKTRHQLGKQFW
jgi:hypothetical protein